MEPSPDKPYYVCVFVYVIQRLVSAQQSGCVLNLVADSFLVRPLS